LQQPLRCLDRGVAALRCRQPIQQVDSEVVQSAASVRARLLRGGRARRSRATRALANPSVALCASRGRRRRSERRRIEVQHTAQLVTRAAGDARSMHRAPSRGYRGGIPTVPNDIANGCVAESAVFSLRDFDA
jgi:hypothetical protein